LLPAGTAIRPHFSSEPGEKRLRNGLFRRFTRILLARRHRTPDYFFSLSPLGRRGRLERVFGYARHSVVEIETHPINPDEYRFLTTGELFQWAGDTPIASGYMMQPHATGSLLRLAREQRRSAIL
jgi:hypothetical protein